MKREHNKKMSLTKLTIAKINPAAMQNIHGGDCIPTDVQNSFDHCKPDPETVGQ